MYMLCGKIRFRSDAKAQMARQSFGRVLVPRFTAFRAVSEKTNASMYNAELANDRARNDMIVADVVAALQDGRSPLILTKLREHVDTLKDMLGSHCPNIICLTGTAPAKEKRLAMERLRAIGNDEPLIVIATGRYVGEGFDCPRLDTLFIALPVSYSNIVQQYTGRLHRDYEGKEEVRVYDYIDVHVPVLARMYSRRLKSYAPIGYTQHAIEALESNPKDIIFDGNTFLPVLLQDISAARGTVVVSCKSLKYAKKAIYEALATASARGVICQIIVKEASDDAQSISSELTIDIAVAGLEGAETKAVKSSWSAGDKLNIWFDGAYWSQLPQLVLTYDGASWNGSEMDASILKSSGKFHVIYEASNSEFTTAHNGNYYYFPGQNVIVSGTTAQTFRSVPMSCYQNGVAYTYSDGKLSAKIASWNFMTMLQVVITGLQKAASNYALKIDNIDNTAAYYRNPTTGDFKSSGFSNGGYSVGVPNEEGVAFYFGTNYKKGSRDVVFTLKERLSKTESIFTKKSLLLSNSTANVVAVKINSRKFMATPEAVDLGLSVKWGSFNVGAAKPEDVGYYYAWGETTRKINYHWGEEGWYKWGVLDSNASPKYGMTKYTATVIGGDGLNTLQSDDDPATANLGAKWRTPTVNEIIELLDDTKCEWTWDATKKVYTVKGLKTGKSIFLPAAGGRYGSGIGSVGTVGSYWSSSVIVYDPRCASSFGFDMNRQT